MLTEQLKQAINQRQAELTSAFTLDWQQELQYLSDLLATAKPAKVGLIEVPLSRCDMTTLVDAFMSLMKFNLSLNPQAKLATIKAAVDHKEGCAIALPEVLAMGYLMAAFKAGLVKNVMGSLLYEGDHFCFNGFYEKPEFKASEQSNKAIIKGGFVCAKMSDGDILTSVISPEELQAAIEESLFKKYGGAKCWSKGDIRDALEASIMRRFLKQAVTFTFANDASEKLIFEILDLHIAYFRKYTEVQDSKDKAYNPRRKACVSQEGSTLLRAIGHSAVLPKLAKQEPEPEDEPVPPIKEASISDLFGLQIGL